MSVLRTAMTRARRRRNRVAYLALLRRSSEYALRTWAVRVVAIVVLAACAVTSRWFVVVLALCVVPSVACVLLFSNERHVARGTLPRTWLGRVYAQNVTRTDGRHRLSLGSYLDILGAFGMLAAPSWVSTDSPLVLRLAMLGAAVCFFVSSVLLIFNDHTWFNPEEISPPVWHEVARLLAGPIVVGLICGIVLPADWGVQGGYAAIVICLTAFTISFRVADTAVIVKYLAPLVREESEAGREQVISETHGALSTNLRLLEQQARTVRTTNPALHELAVAANSRLRETLANARLHGDDGDLANLGAPVLTLARAVGARAVVDVALTSLSTTDHDLVQLVLSDLVGNALNAGAADVTVRIDEQDGLLRVSVTDDAPPMHLSVWRSPGTSSARLAERLQLLGGDLGVTHTGDNKFVRATWTPQP